jgi:(1->4)-alpha-D-glucan 1-alpha-D-glucosylmutase
MLIPTCTYRIQLNKDFTLRHLKGILDYLHELGVSTVYASPITTATKGSMHGYDTTDPLTLNAEIGTEEEWQQVSMHLRRYGMDWLQDIVPNHMAWHSSNPWLFDVLERGRDSGYYSWFDIILDHPVPLPGDKLMAPFLGSTLTECLQKAELSVHFTSSGFVIRYYDQEYPVAAQLYRWICTVADGHPSGLLPILDTFEEAIPDDPDNWKTAKQKCLRQLSAISGWPAFVTTRTAFINKRINLLQSLLQNQHYVLTHATLAASHINYRRFFAVNSLICLSMERPAVFEAYHATIYRWYREGRINGFRIDHIDGLAEPQAYLQKLTGLFGKDCYIVAEKILSQQEAMPPGWPIAGSTGYDFLAAAGQLLTDADGSRELLNFYKEQIAPLPAYDDLVFERKLGFLRRNMGGELDNLFVLLMRLPQAAVMDEDRLKQALAVWMSSFPVYRAYPDENGGSPADGPVFRTSLSRSQARRPDMIAEFAFFATLLPEVQAVASSWLPEAQAPANISLPFITRLMQFTGPLAAKGIEDTTFYIYNPYIAHCEVGDTPGIAGTDTGEFHRKMQDRQAHQRYALNATSTHDTKRGEDSRMRLSVLSARPAEFTNAVTHWFQLNESHTAVVGGRRAPSANDEYLIYQAMLGSFPTDGFVTDSFRGRFAAYLTKALREADTETSYQKPDLAYEQQCQAFATALLLEDSPFLAEFIPFSHSMIRQSAAYSLSLLLLKLTAPGIPDIYQGSELWETSLVDPDNRRPVDFILRASLLRQLKSTARDPNKLFAFIRNNQAAGAEKLFTLWRTLECRNRFPRLFAEGDYIPVPTHGPILSYCRRHDDQWILVAIPLIRYGSAQITRRCLSLPPEAPSQWMDVFTGAGFPANGSTLSWPDDATAWPVLLLTGHNPHQ